MKTKLRNKRMGLARILLLAVILISVTPVTPIWADGPQNGDLSSQILVTKKTTPTIGEYVLNEVVVRFESYEVAELELPLTGAIEIDSLGFGPVYLLRYGLAPVDPVQVAKELAKKHGVDYAHPNFVTASGHGVEGSRPVGDDPGGNPKSKQTTDETLKLDMIDSVTSGNGVKVAIVDGGIQFDHPYFAGMTFAGYDFIGKDSYAYDEPGGEISGHGTFVAGLIHMIAPDAELVPYRVIDPDGRGDGFTIARAIERAVNEGCKLINISIVLTDRHWAVKDAIEYAELHNVPVIVAAGNGSTSNDCYPAAERASIAVAAIDEANLLADFSNYGPNIDVCAPGVGTYSAYVDGIYAYWDGTSFATACVTGQLALMTQLHPTFTIDEYNTVIAENSIDLDQYNPLYVDSLGYGLINTYKAVIAAGVLGIIAYDFPEDPSLTLTVTPDFIQCPGIVRYSFDIARTVEIASSNAPAVFHAEVLQNQNTFTTFQAYTYLRTTSGLTNSSVVIHINLANIYKAGVYTNMVAFRIAGVIPAVFLEIEVTVTDPDKKEATVQVKQLSVGNYPNPFNPTTTIQFAMPEASHVSLKVYNALGQQVNCLLDQWMPAGEHRVDFSGTNSRGEALSSGMYFYRIETNQKSETRKMILLK